MEFTEAIEKCDETDKMILRLCAHLSLLVYMSREKLDQYLSQVYVLDSYAVVPLKRTQVICIRFRQKVFIAFQGSSTLMHWVSNFDLRCGNAAGIGKFHYGFYRAALDFLDDRIMLEVIAWSDDHDIIWCGHSRGGAIAGITAALMTSWGVSSTHIITYGAPKYADIKHVEWVTTNMKETNIIRIVHTLDIVPNSPPSSLKEIGIIVGLAILIPFSFLLSKLKINRK